MNKLFYLQLCMHMYTSDGSLEDKYKFKILK